MFYLPFSDCIYIYIYIYIVGKIIQNAGYSKTFQTFTYQQTNMKFENYWNPLLSCWNNWELTRYINDCARNKR